MAAPIGSTGVKFYVLLKKRTATAGTLGIDTAAWWTTGWCAASGAWVAGEAVRGTLPVRMHTERHAFGEPETSCFCRRAVAGEGTLI